MTWKHVNYSPRLSAQVPQAPGVYAVVEVARVHALPVSLKLRYVGQSLDLRRRFKDHANAGREHNGPLRRATASHRERLEFWCIEASPRKLDALERELIALGSPTDNIIRYGETI